MSCPLMDGAYLSGDVYWGDAGRELLFKKNKEVP